MRNISLLVAKQYKFANRELAQLPFASRRARVENRQMIEKYAEIDVVLSEACIIALAAFLPAPYND
jgi:hypothetical protein